MTKKKTKGEQIKLEQVQKFHKENQERWLNVLSLLERTLTSARDNREAPIYLTKARVKHPESAYLKIKRKRKDGCSDLTDWLGFRVLCLFKQDIVPTYRMLIDLMLNKRSLLSEEKYHFDLNEVNLFHLPEQISEQLKEIMLEAFSGFRKTVERRSDKGMDIAYSAVRSNGLTETVPFSLKVIDRQSGYQSVHFLVVIHEPDGRKVTCELQLRTLLQDVWGELEHALSYKRGKIHPHISNSFQLLSKELEAKDILVSQLRDIRDQEIAVARYSQRNSAPRNWFSYPKSIWEIFEKSGESVHEKFKSYAALFADFKPNKHANPAAQEAWVAQATKLLGELQQDAGGLGVDQLNYAIGMEKAFLCFHEGKVTDAEAEYKRIVETPVGGEYWFPFFRLGEIYLVQDKINEALVAFDRCEDLMSEANSPRDRVDCYFAKIGLAYTYWQLGREFLPTVIEKVEEASSLVEPLLARDWVSTGEEVNIPLIRSSLANNLCYYYLEYWLDTPVEAGVEDKHRRLQIATAEFEKLKEFERDHADHVSSNMMDTMAWYCYHMAENSRDRADVRTHIQEAQKYIVKAEALFNRAPSRLTSMAIQREHLQAIMTKDLSSAESAPGHR